MRFRKSIVLMAAAGLISAASIAQQVPMYSQYVMNGFLINPSIAGRDGYTSVNLTIREQWVGFPGAPQTYAASFQTRLLKNSYISKSTSVKKKMVRPTKGGNVGLGGYIFNDRNGIMSRTGILAAYAYHLPLGKTEGMPKYLSLGLAGTFYQFAVDLTGQVLNDVDDEFLTNYAKVVYIPDFNFGATYTTDNYYVGLSLTSIARGNILWGTGADNNNNTELGYFYLTGGAKIRFKSAPDWELQPSALIKTSDMFFKSMQMDLTARMYYKESYWAGLSFRTNDAVIALFGLRYDKFYFAYAYDFIITDIRKQSYGSHELSLAVKFGESARRYRWINAY